MSSSAPSWASPAASSASISCKAKPNPVKQKPRRNLSSAFFIESAGATIGRPLNVPYIQKHSLTATTHPNTSLAKGRGTARSVVEGLADSHKPTIPTPPYRRGGVPPPPACNSYVLRCMIRCNMRVIIDRLWSCRGIRRTPLPVYFSNHTVPVMVKMLMPGTEVHVPTGFWVKVAASTVTRPSVVAKAPVAAS